MALNDLLWVTPSKAAQAEAEKIKLASQTEQESVRKLAEERIARIEADLARTLASLKERQETSTSDILSADIERQKQQVQEWQEALQAHKQAVQSQVATVKAETSEAAAARLAAFVTPSLKCYPGVFAKGGELWENLKKAVAAYVEVLVSLKTDAKSKEGTLRIESETEKQEGIKAVAEHLSAVPLPGHPLAAFALGAHHEKQLADVTALIEDRAAELLKKELAKVRTEFAEAKGEAVGTLLTNLGEVGVGTTRALAGTGANVLDAVVVVPSVTVATAVKTAADVAQIKLAGREAVSQVYANSAATRPPKPGKEPAPPALAA